MYLVTYIMYLETRKEENKIKGRAEYFRQRREQQKGFYVEIDIATMTRLEKRLSEKNKTKTQWLKEKIEEELSEDVETKK